MKKKVLIVDDNKSMRKLEKEIIKGINSLEVFEATNGKEAFNLLQEKPFYLLVTDICMPEMNGIELVDKLRARGVSIPIIILSGLLNNQIRKYLNSHTSINILEKPFDIEHLAETIKIALS